MKILVKTKDLEKSYGKKKALRGISLNVPEGKVYGLLGPNGAGKTTTISILSGLIRKSGGSFEIDGVLDSEGTKRLVGLVPQDSNLYGSLTSLDQMIFFARLQGLSKTDAKKESLELLELVGLKEELNTKINRLSHGMRRRIGLAQALIGNPRLLIFDEPTSGLDPVIAKSIRSLIKDLKARDVTIIFCSHNLYEVEEICDWVGIMDKGELVKELDLASSTKTSSVSMQIRGLKEEIINTINKKSYVRSVDYSGDILSVHFRTGDKTNDLLDLLVKRGVRFDKLKKGGGLEDLFIKLVGEN